MNTISKDCTERQMSCKFDRPFSPLSIKTYTSELKTKQKSLGHLEMFPFSISYFSRGRSCRHTNSERPNYVCSSQALHIREMNPKSNCQNSFHGNLLNARLFAESKNRSFGFFRLYARPCADSLIL